MTLVDANLLLHAYFSRFPGLRHRNPLVAA
jgi:hypothetical protein